MDKIKLVKSTTCNYELLNLGIIHNSMFLSEMMHQRLANRFPSLCEAQSLKDCDMIHLVSGMTVISASSHSLT